MSKENPEDGRKNGQYVKKAPVTALETYKSGEITCRGFEARGVPPGVWGNPTIYI
jgi:hypothetical protein